MTLPASGAISLSQVNTELSKASTALITMNDANVRSLAGKASGAIAMSDLHGKSSVIKKTISASVNNVIIQNLFTAAEWSSATPKEVTINAGVVVGSTSAGTAALRSGTGNGGTVKIINNGSIRGAGGATTSAAGGDAVETSINLTIENNGDIRGGGGGGGKGGTGGTGGGGTVTTTARDPSSGYNYTAGSYYWRTPAQSGGNTTIYWNGTLIYNAAGQPTSVTVGNITYYRGPNAKANQTIPGPGPGGQPPIVVSTDYDLYRNVSTTTNTNGGAGGAGGNGGRGIGSDAAAAAGAAGANGSAGGTNAGAGGKGGTGGTGGGWGAAGSTGGTGSTGANGNRTNGLAGAAGVAGGAAGKAAERLSGAVITWTVTGTRSGAV